MERTWTYPVNSQGGVQETLRYDATPLTQTAIARNARGVETTRTTTIGTSNTVTRTTADTTAGRDTADRWAQATIAKSGAATVTLNRGFDNAGRITGQSGAGFSSAGTCTYDAGSGQKTAESLPLSLGGTITGAYSYTADGRLASATIGGVTGTYSFDGAGNLVANTEGATTNWFDYDPTNRLRESSDGTTKTVYGWDTTNGWRVSQGPDTNPYQIQFTYTKSGGSTSIGRLMRYQNAATSTDASYTYDAEGQRTRSVVTVSGATTTSDYAYDGLTLLKLSAAQGSTSWRIDYLYDEEGRPYGGLYRSPASSTSPTYFTIVTSDRGDVVELLDGNGAAFAAYRYDAWGLPRGSGDYATGIWTQSTSLVTSTLAGQIASRQVLRYAGYAWDTHSVLYYCSARYYDPATRQWTTGDPAKADGEASAYQYCEGESISRVDPTGLHVGVNQLQSANDGRVKLWLGVELQQATISLSLTGVHLTRFRTGAKVLNSSYRLAKIGLRFYMFSHGHSDHDGGHFVRRPHYHYKIGTDAWYIPVVGQPESGKTYYRDPTPWLTHPADYPSPKVYNAINRAPDLLSDGVYVRSRLRYFNKYTGANKYLENTWQFTHPYSAY